MGKTELSETLRRPDQTPDKNNARENVLGEKAKKIPGLWSIRHRILLFSILVTLIPSIVMAWFFYTMTYNAATENLRQKLVESAGHVERQMDGWMAERERDLTAFATSPVLVDNLQAYLETKHQAAKSDRQPVPTPEQRLAAFLGQIRHRMADTGSVALFDKTGHRIVASTGVTGSFNLPADWRGRIATTRAVIGEVVFEKDESRPFAMIGIPILSGRTGEQLGVLATQVGLRPLLPFLDASLVGETGPRSVALVQKNGRRILFTASPKGQKDTALSPSQKHRLFTHPFQMKEFDNTHWVVGLAVPFTYLPWGLLMTRSYDDVYAGVIRLRDKIALTAIVVILIIGLMALVVARQILLPLSDLTRGVLRLGEGDLDVALDIRKNDELGIVTGMVNDMAKQLKQNQQELEDLRITDALTGLVGRKQIMKILDDRIENHRRYANGFALLMIDIDHFKRINDTHGHLVGDAVLVQLAQILSGLLRSLDVAGRFGGEEFLVILEQTDSQGGVLTAERIRQAVEQYPFVYQGTELNLTISVGVTAIQGMDDTDNILIARVDDALFEAKTGGRNRVVLAGESRPEAGT